MTNLIGLFLDAALSRSSERPPEPKREPVQAANGIEPAWSEAIGMENVGAGHCKEDGRGAFSLRAVKRPLEWNARRSHGKSCS
ncbi:MAG: hypothetical protein RBU30_21380 [Polyangia bacterium]|jgi:hypothetical protein|nr:hypothetical protein [Polyangia bacterium]